MSTETGRDPSFALIGMFKNFSKLHSRYLVFMSHVKCKMYYLFDRVCFGRFLLGLNYAYRNMLKKFHLTMDLSIKYPLTQPNILGSFEKFANSSSFKMHH